MTISTLTIRESHYRNLQRLLLREDHNEHAAYVLCRKAVVGFDPWERQRHEKLLVVDVIPVPDADVVEAAPNIISWTTASFVSLLKRSHRDGLIVGIAHSHPHGPLSFSPQDNSNEPDLVQLAENRNGAGTPILSVVMTGDGQLEARLWISVNGYFAVRLSRVIGRNIRLFYPNRGEGISAATHHRQALALGRAFTQDMHQLKIAIIGCGGTGSAVATLLARLGVGQLALFDNDIVDSTNLNRLHGARQADADAMRPKVEVVAQSITDLGLGVRVVTAQAWVGDPEYRDMLKACDVIFGCTDDHDGRLLLNRYAYYYLTPVFDTGLAIDVTREDPPTIRAMDGRVTVLYPEHTCLACREVVSPSRARDEDLKRKTPEEYEKRKLESYVVGGDDPNPAVITFTTETATMAVNEFIHRLQGFRGEDGAVDQRVRKFNLGVDVRAGKQRRDGCRVCNDPSTWGRGDTPQFLDRID